MTRCLCLTLVLAGCVPSPVSRGVGPAAPVPGGTVLRVEVTPDEADAIRARTIYAGAMMRYHAFVSDTGIVEFWHDGELLAVIDDRGVVTYAPVILSRGEARPGGPFDGSRAFGGVARSFDELPARAIVQG